MARREEYISNPGLVKAMKAVKEANSSVTQNTVVLELLKAQLLIPVTVKKAQRTALENPDAERQKDQLLFHMIQNTAKQQYFLAFTDMGQLRKWKDNPDQKTAILTFDDYAALVLDTNAHVAGISIDPFGENLIMTREMVRDLRRQKRMRESGGIDLTAILPQLRS